MTGDVLDQRCKEGSDFEFKQNFCLCHDFKHFSSIFAAGGSDVGHYSYWKAFYSSLKMSAGKKGIYDIILSGNTIQSEHTEHKKHEKLYVIFHISVHFCESYVSIGALLPLASV